jgi:polysaccharide biosynthesis protein PslG
MKGGEPRMMRAHGPLVRRVLALAALAIVAALVIAPGAEAKGGKNLFGLNYSFTDITGKDARMLKKSGAKTVRWIMFWPRIEPTSGHFNWTVPDKVVGDLAAKGIRVVPIMWGSPRWVESTAITPPTDTQAARNAWKKFLQSAVKRYGPKGKFWRKSFKKAHHHKKPQPITTWEVWNEPNLKGAMNPPGPALYADLLKLSHSAIKDANRHAKVMFGGLLSHSPSGPSAADFLNAVYKQPGAKKTFDVGAVHAYASSADDMLDNVHKVRQVMNANGDRDKPLWVAELGWGSLPKNPHNFGETQGLHGQAKILKKSFQGLKKKRKQWNIGKALWFNFRDPAGGNPRICAYCTSAGLLTNSYQPKPSWNAFRKFTR